jgi:hypothetical protein
LDFVKIRNFCASEDIIRIKRQPTEWKKIFANKETTQFKMGKDLAIQMAISTGKDVPHISY